MDKKGDYLFLIKDKVVLQIVSDRHNDSFKISKKAEEEGNLAYNNWWYFHGKLEEYYGYDKGNIINAKELLKSNHCLLIPEFDTLKQDYDKGYYYTEEEESGFRPHLMFDGIIKCNILGLKDSCVGFFWVVDKYPLKIVNPQTKKEIPGEFYYGRQRGLVCLESDKDSVNYAFECFKRKNKSI